MSASTLSSTPSLKAFEQNETSSTSTDLSYNVNACDGKSDISLNINNPLSDHWTSESEPESPLPKSDNEIENTFDPNEFETKTNDTIYCEDEEQKLKLIDDDDKSENKASNEKAHNKHELLSEMENTTVFCEEMFHEAGDMINNNMDYTNELDDSVSFMELENDMNFLDYIEMDEAGDCADLSHFSLTNNNHCLTTSDDLDLENIKSIVELDTYMIPDCSYEFKPEELAKLAEIDQKLEVLKQESQYMESDFFNSMDVNPEPIDCDLSLLSDSEIRSKLQEIDLKLYNLKQEFCDFRQTLPGELKTYFSDLNI